MFASVYTPVSAGTQSTEEGADPLEVELVLSLPTRVLGTQPQAEVLWRSSSAPKLLNHLAH